MDMIGLYLFYGIPAFVLIYTIALKQGFSFFMANTLWIGYRVMIVFLWWIILFEEGHELSSRILFGLFFAYPLYSTITTTITDGIFLGGAKSSGKYNDIEDQGAVDVDDF